MNKVNNQVQDDDMRYSNFLDTLNLDIPFVYSSYISALVASLRTATDAPIKDEWKKYNTSLKT